MKKGEVKVLVLIIIALIFFGIASYASVMPTKKGLKNLIDKTGFDIDGKETVLPGLRTEFRNHDVAWSFMKQHKEAYPLNNFALVSDVKKDRKKVMFRYI